MALTAEEHKVKVEKAQVHLYNMELREDVMLDEVHIEADTVFLKAPLEKGGQPEASANLSMIRIIMTEPNINRLLTANIPPEAPIRDLELAILTGKIKAAGKMAQGPLMLHFTAEVTPQIRNGTKIWLQLNSLKAGFGLPGAFKDAAEEQINSHLKLDLSALPFPLTLEEIRCEPGRLTAIGKARVAWPISVISQALPRVQAPFTAVAIPSGE